MRLLALLAALGGCASFEDPTLVIDMRVLGMTMIPAPERVIDIDLQAETPPTLDDILRELSEEPTPVVCALVSDPVTTRDLRYSMRACILDDNARCDPTKPTVPVAAGQIYYDPEVWQGGSLSACHEIPVDSNFVALLFEALKASPGSALAGIDYGVEMRIGRADEHPELDLFAVKHGRVSARIPDTRQANNNPGMLELQIAGSSGFPFVESSPRPCSQPFGSNAIVTPGDVVTLYPVEVEGSRETFVTPTLDGQFLEFEEYMTYQWLAQRGSFSDATTGGPPDFLGNEKLLGTEWTAPAVASRTDVPIWVLQRDDRYGVTWWESCITVQP